MIDLHCHILPGVDDGAFRMEDAIEMAWMASDSGVTTIVATPHCNLPNSEQKNYISSELKYHFYRLQRRIKQEKIPLTILPGSEVMCTPDVPKLIRSGNLLTLAGSDYLLVEFFFDEESHYMDEMLSAIKAEGLIPVIAHPERYEAIQENPAIVERWFRNDYVIQLNKGSILGNLGRQAAFAADWILSQGLAHVVASDAHSPTVRTTNMTELREYLTGLCSSGYTEVLLDINPNRIINNLPILQAE